MSKAPLQRDNSGNTKYGDTLLKRLEDEFTAIIGFAELVQADPGDRPDRCSEIILAGERALRLVRNADAVSGSRASDRCYVNHLLLDRSAELECVAGPRVRISKQIDSHVGTIPMSEHDTELLLNLLVAAARNSMTGEAGRITIRTLHSGASPSGRATVGLIVEDDGIGVERSDPRAILADDSLIDKQTAVSRMRSMISNCGGSVTIKSESNMGATVRIEFPAV